MSIKLNKIYNENCLETMARMPDNFVDLTVTSPPYDNLRKYNGYSFPFEEIAKELFRVTKEGGVVVWVVGDATINRSETGTSFKQALYFKECGFNLHDTMIYKKNSSSFPSSLSGKRYTQIFEFMFVFCKYRIKSHNLIIDKKNKWAGFSSFDGKIDKVKEHSPRENIWEYVTSFNDNTGHPAVFPEQLAADHIRSWSNENDIVYDCFGGSGTTAKMAHILKRNWILSEISAEYCKLAEKRIAPYLMQKTLF
jgi:site-specific DNA-methyltransferase (adenine-specific)